MFDVSLQHASRAPIERGGRFGMTGNGQQQLQIRELLKTIIDLSGLNSEVDSVYFDEVSKIKFDYFDCPGCHCPI
jgi:hypothetical protein